MHRWIVACVLAMTLASSHAIGAQQPDKLRRIGSLSAAAQPSARDEAFKKNLRELGWIEGKNISIEYRWTAGKRDQLSAQAEELVRLKVDVIVAWAGPAALAAKNATRTIPIVMGTAADPIGIGLIESLARPGGNITGVSLMAPELAGKRLQLLKELVPGLSRVAFLASGSDPAHRLFVKETEEAGQKLGIHIQPLVVRGPGDFEEAFAAMIKERSGALIVQPLFITIGGHGPALAKLAIKHRLPTISDGNQFAELGGLIYYGPERVALDRRVAYYVDRILKGAKPAELPVEQPQTFELAFNLQTAKQLGITIPQSLLFRADKVIK